MKILIKKAFFILMWIFSKVYTYRISLIVCSIRDMFYTCWIQYFFGVFGKYSSIHFPCSLQGNGSKRISIGHHTNIQSHVILGCWEAYGLDQHFKPSITIGNHCNIGEYTQITAINKISIGDGLLTGRYVYIGDNAHGGLSWEEAEIPPIKRHLESKGEIIIGKNVWIGDKVTILGGVTIGDNVIIGANSVVTHDLPSNSMAAGMPARVIKQLSINLE